MIIFSKGKICADGTAEEVLKKDTIFNIYNVKADITPVDGCPYVIFHADESVEDSIVVEEENEEL